MDERLRGYQKKYVAEKTRSFTIRFNHDNDGDVISKLEKVPSSTDYIRTLVREDKGIRSSKPVIRVKRRAGGSWVAKGEDFELKDTSYDVLLHKIKHQMGDKHYVVITDSIGY